MPRTNESLQAALSTELYTVDLLGANGESAMRLGALGLSLTEAQQLHDRLTYKHPDFPLAIRPLQPRVQS